MTVTQLDERSALLVIDLQRAVLALPASHPIEGVVDQAAGLAAAFRARDLPVVLVRVVGGAPGRTERVGGGLGALGPEAFELAPELDAQAGDHIVEKRTWGAFTGTGLHELLSEQGVTQVVVCGVSTSIGVETTARSAYALGYNVAIASDAVTDRDEASHEHAMTKIFPRLGEVATTAELLELLARR